MVDSVESTTGPVAPTASTNPAGATPEADHAIDQTSDSVRYRLVSVFPRQDTMKLEEGNFIQWQQHVKFIVEGYELTGFVDGSLHCPPRFLTDQDDNLTRNPEFAFFQQQDKLLASWLLSTIINSILVCFIGVKTSCDIWSTANRLFVAVTGSQLSRVKHDLHAIKKGTLFIKEYVAKIQNTCALIEASGHPVSEVEVEVILTDLTLERDAVVAYASFTSEPLTMGKIIDMLMEYEGRSQRMALTSKSGQYAQNRG